MLGGPNKVYENDINYYITPNETCLYYCGDKSIPMRINKKNYIKSHKKKILHNKRKQQIKI